MIRLTPAILEQLRDRLRTRGERPSLVLGNAKTSADVLEAVSIVQEFGPLVEAMFLVMLADGKVKNVERDVLRGALRALSADRVRSIHLESMLDVAAHNVAEEGFDARLDAVIEKLRGDQARAEIAYVIGSAVAAADDVIVPEEARVLSRFAEGLGIDEERANKLLTEFDTVEEEARKSLPPQARPGSKP